MNKFFLGLLLVLVVGCKKDKPAVSPLPATVKEKYKPEAESMEMDSVALTENKDSLLVDFYRMHHFRTVWNHAEIREAIVYMLSKADVEDGLDPGDYYLSKLQGKESKIKSLSIEEKAAYDILLTKAMRKYLRQLSGGKLSPTLTYRTWSLKRNRLNINELLSGGLNGDTLSSVIENAKPSHVIYRKLVDALQIINQLPEDKNFKVIDTLFKIRRNDTASCVADIKKRLIFWKDMLPQDTLTNIYDRKAFAAMKKFQARHGLTADGVVGKGTIKALNFTKEQRKGQIIANLERWRWFPKEMGHHYLIINIPEYLMSVVKDGDTIEQKRIVVGKNKRRTPVLSSTFSNIVFNPTWTVPPTIIKEDLIPDATKDRSYFARKDLTIYDRKGKVVSAENWNPAKAKGYRYVQKPGNENSLGNVKFNFPSPFSVYLHDTNHRNLFVMHSRSFSSGCVRIENPLPLAAYMLNDSIKYSLEKINEIIATEKTTSVTLKEKINVHQLYWTAWSENGKLIFREDIYGLDPGLYYELRK